MRAIRLLIATLVWSVPVSGWCAEMQQKEPIAAAYPLAAPPAAAPGHVASGYDDSKRVPVLFVPVQPGTYKAGANTDNYGRPLQPRSFQ